MKEIELCMKYDTCNRCPLNMKCEEEYQKEMEQKSGGKCGKRPSNVQVLWSGSARAYMSAQEKPTKER